MKHTMTAKITPDVRFDTLGCLLALSANSLNEAAIITQSPSDGVNISRNAPAVPIGILFVAKKEVMKKKKIQKA